MVNIDFLSADCRAAIRNAVDLKMSTRSAGNGTSPQGIQVISRAAAILRALKEADDGLSLGQIARRVDLPRSTVQRIVNALASEGLVMTSPAGGGLRLGPEIQSLAAAGKIDIADFIRPLLTALSHKTGETVDLAELQVDHLIFIDQIVGTHRLRTAATVGEVFPLTSTANGKASLALLDDNSAVDLIKSELNANGSRPGLLRNLLAEIELTRERGYAYDLDEYTDGISAVGAAFKTPDGQVYAISVPAPSRRFVESQQDLTDSLMDTIEQVKSVLS